MTFAMLLPYILSAGGVVVGWIARHRGIGPVPATPPVTPSLPAPTLPTLPDDHPLIQRLLLLVQALEAAAVKSAPNVLPSLQPMLTPFEKQYPWLKTAENIVMELLHQRQPIIVPVDSTPATPTK